MLQKKNVKIQRTLVNLRKIGWIIFSVLMELNVFYINIKLNSFLHCALIPTERLKSLTSCIWMFYASKVFRGPCHLISTHILATRTHAHTLFGSLLVLLYSSSLIIYLLIQRYFHWRKRLQTLDLCTWTRCFCFCLWNL